MIQIKYNGDEKSGVEVKVDSGRTELDMTIIKSAIKSWTAKYDKEENKTWCKMYGEYGLIETYTSLMGGIKIKVAENSGEERKCVISIECNGENAVISITQDGIPKE